MGKSCSPLEKEMERGLKLLTPFGERDVFLLPETSTMEVFTDVFDACLNFYKDVEYVIYAKRTTDKKDYYKENYETKIAEQRKVKETCECGMIVTHYSMTRHKKSSRHFKSMESIKNKPIEL